jgi:ribonuclease HI
MIRIATDGSCIQQGGFAKGDDTPRPGAAGFVAVFADGSKARSAQPYPNGTIGIMETTALLMALEFVRATVQGGDQEVLINCDSKYVVDTANQWMHGWAANGWRKKTKGAIVGLELWQRIHALLTGFGPKVRIEWVKAHAGHPLNEECDTMVNTCARTQVAVETPSISPVDEKPVHFVRDEPSPSAKTLFQRMSESRGSPRETSDETPPWEVDPAAAMHAAVFRDLGGIEPDAVVDALSGAMGDFVPTSSPIAPPSREAQLETLLRECLGVIGNPHMPWDQATRELAGRIRDAVGA